MTSMIIPFIRGLKQLYPESTWLWLFNALRHDPQVWDSLGGELGQELLSIAPESAEDLTPAYLSFLALGQPVDLYSLRAIPMQPLAEEIAADATTSDPLTTAGLDAIRLRERRRLAGDWNELRVELSKTSPTALACLFGMVPDSVELIQNLLQFGSSNDSSPDVVDLAVQAYLCNPFSPETRFEFLSVLFGQLSSDTCLSVLHKLADEQPGLATSLAQDLPHRLELDEIRPVPGTFDPTLEIRSGLKEIDALQLAGQSAAAVEALRHVAEKMCRQQAELKARIARIELQGGNIQEAIKEWEEVRQLDPRYEGYPAELALAYLEAGRSTDADNCLARLEPESTHPLVHLARARLALEGENREEAGQEAIKALELMDSRTQLRKEVDPKLVGSLATLLLDIKQPAKAVRAAEIAAQSRPDEAEFQALLGKAHAAVGALEPAVLADQLAVLLAPSRLDLHRQLAQDLELSGDWDAAMDERSILVERLVPASSDNLHALAACALKAGRPAHAIHVCQQLLQLNPDDGIAYTRLGEATAALGDTQSALDYLHKAIQLSPSQPLPWLVLAKFHEDSGGAQKAQETLRAATYAAPEYPEIHLALGENYLEQGALTQALNDLRLAAELSSAQAENPPYSQVAIIQAALRRQIALRLGQTLHQLGHQEEAARVLKEAYQAAPSNTELASGYAQILVAQGKLYQALAPLETILQSEPDNTTPYLEYGRCLLSLYMEGGYEVRVEDALPALRHVLDVQSDHAEAIALLGEALAATGDPEQAIEAFNKALSSDLVNDPLWQARLSLGLGQASLQTGQIETAVAALQEANQIDPLNPVVLRSLAEAYEAAGLTEDAFQTARAALLLAPSDVDTLIWFADEAMRLQKRPGAVLPDAEREAVNALNRAAQLAPSRADLIVKLGQTQLKMGDQTSAQESFRLLATSENANPCMEGRVCDFHQAAKGLLQIGDPQGSIACLENALQLAKTHEHLPETDLIELLTDLSDAYLQSGNTEAAIQSIEQAINIAPNEPNLFLLKANLLAEIEKVQAWGANNGAIDSEVLHCLETAIRLNPGDPALHHRVALIHRASGHLSAAMVHAQHMIDTCQDLRPEIIPARALAAELALAMLQTQRARSFLEYELPGVNRINEVLLAGMLDTHCLRAELALETNEDYIAINELVKAVEIGPEDPRVQSLQARLAFRRNEDETAINLFNASFESVADLSPQSPAVLRAIAEAGLELQQWDKTLLTLDKLVKNTPFEPLSHFALGRALVLRAEQQRLYQAVEVVQRAPGEAALSAEAKNSFEIALGKAEGLLVKWTNGQKPGAEPSIEHWRGRGEAAFDPSPQSAQKLATLSPNPESIAAQIACLRITGNLTSAGLLAREYPKNPLILLQLALALVNEKPRQSLAAAHAAADLLAEAQANGQSRPAYRNKDLAPIVQALLARLFQRSGNRAGDHADAIQSIKNALGYWPDEPRWHILAAEIYEGHNQPDDLTDLEEVIEHLETAIQLDPKYAPPYLTLGQIYLNLGLLSKATQTCEMASRLAPDQPEAWHLLAEAYHAQGDLDQAAIHAERAVTLSPDQAAPLVLWGEILLEADDPQAAQSKAKAALQLEPDYPDALLLLAKSLEALDRQSEALAVIDQALQNVPQPLPLLLERVRLINHDQGIQAASQAIQELNQRFPDRPEILAVVAEIQARSGQPEEAIHIAQRALRLNGDLFALATKDQARLHLLLGKLLRQAGQLDQAIYHLSEAARLTPDLVESYLELGEAHKERRQYAQALNAYRQAIAVAPQDYRPYYQIGITLKDSKDYPGAEKMLRRATELAPADPSIHRLLAAVVALNLVQNHRETVPGVPTWDDTF